MGDLNKYFSRSEFACKCGCGQNTVDAELLNYLIQIREHFNSPVKVTSGNRCKSHNRAVGGSISSQHLYGRAADIVVRGVDPIEVQNYASSIGVSGLGSYETFTHIDSRNGNAAWSG